MSLSAALHLASLGFHVFPLIPNSKLPLIEDFPRRATRSEAQIRDWWMDPVLELEQPYNVGISTSRFGDNEALVVVDIDNKEGKKGDDEILRLELEGLEFHSTFEQQTPTGGRHVVYRCDVPVKQGSNVLARGIDIRSKGGFIVGAGSVTEDGIYTETRGDIQFAPQWLTSRLKNATSRERSKENGSESAQPSRATRRAVDYLVNHAPLAVQGASGDETTFKVACRIKDIGVDALTACELMFERWNNRCSPPWSIEELRRKIENAYAYGENKVGVDDPASQFSVIEKEDNIPGWVKEMNSRYCVVNERGKVVVLTKAYDYDLNRRIVDRTSFEDLKKEYLNDFIGSGKKPLTRAEAWLSHRERHQCLKGVAFAPNENLPAGVYNLWQGFSVEPKPGSWTLLEDHIKSVICAGNPELEKYVMGWLARLVQKPGERGEVALVLKGKRGVGKGTLGNVLLDVVGVHGIHITQSKHLVGNFNSHLRDSVFVFADEAYFAGDVQNESVLKGLVTEPTFQAEAKFQNAVEVKNRIHLLMASNEGWVVPAGVDERRYCVVDVSDRYQQNHEYFEALYHEIANGGTAAFLHDLLSYDITKFNVRKVPKTEGLHQQKLRSLKPPYQWWFESLMNESIGEGDFGWPAFVEKSRLRDSLYRYLDKRNIGNWRPDEIEIGKMLAECVPSVFTVKRKAEDGERRPFYAFPTIKSAREQWDKFVGHTRDWELDELTEEERIFA